MAFIRFLIVGGLGFVIDSGITLTLIYFGLSAFIARLPAILSAMAFTWLANRRITFRLGTKPSGKEVMRYFTVAISMACFNYLLFSLLIMLNLPAFLAITFATATQTVLSFYGYKKLVFRTHNERVVTQEPSPLATAPHKTLQTALWIVALMLLITNVAFKYRGEFTADSSNLLKSVQNFAGFWEKER